MKEKRQQLVQALQGLLEGHHRFLMESQLRQLDFFDLQFQELDQEIAHRVGLLSDILDPGNADGTLRPPTHEQTQETPLPTGEASSIPPLSAQPAVPKLLSSAAAIRIIDEVTGIHVRIGAMVIAELGGQMDRFPDQAHLSCWVSLCPAANISANKRLSTKTGKGNRWLRQALIEAANAAAWGKGTFLGADYHPLRKHMGDKKAIVALAHGILIIIHHLLKEQQAYRELGSEHVDEKASDVTLQSSEIA